MNTPIKKSFLSSLLDSSNIVAAVFNASHNGIVILDSKGVIVFYNAAASRIFNEDHKRVSGQRFSDVRPQAWPDLKHVLETGQAQIGRKITLPQATIIVNRSPILVDSHIVGAISIFQDISEYETIISKLQGYKSLHREMDAIFESSEDGLYITDGTATTIRVNSAYERITGLSRKNLLGKTMKTLVSEGIFDYSATLAVLDRQHQVSMMQYVRRDKRVMVTSTPIFNEDEKIELIVTNVRDITELNSLRTELDNSQLLRSRYCQTIFEQEVEDSMFKNMVVKSKEMAQVVHRAVKVASSDISILITGESGTGKSMLARTIHQMSLRKEEPFVKINCGAIPESLIESELFGYEKGAFTGASGEGKAGLIETAHGGTLFLDEIGELQLDLQVKLLEVLEEKTFTRLGSVKSIVVDVRIIAATNRDLYKMMKQKLFREDLFYRLSVVPIDIPPLRSRREDIPALIYKFLEEFNHKHSSGKVLASVALNRLLGFSYPGNIRQLLNILEQITVMSEQDTITQEDLPLELQEPSLLLDRDTSKCLKEALGSLEKRMIQDALKNHPTELAAARSLAIHTTTLWRKAKKYGLR